MFPIYIKLLSGDTFTLDVTEDTEVNTVKQYIYSMDSKYEMAIQRLLVDKRVLQKATLGWYGIKEEQMLFLYIEEFVRIPPAHIFLEWLRRYDKKWVEREIGLCVGKANAFRLGDSNFHRQRNNYNDEPGSAIVDKEEVQIGISEKYKAHMMKLPVGATICGTVSKWEIQEIIVGNPLGITIELVRPIHVYVGKEEYQVPVLDTIDFDHVVLYAFSIEENII